MPFDNCTIMPLAAYIKKFRYPILLIAVAAAAIFLFWNPLVDFYYLFTDRAKIDRFISGWGPSAPLVFILIQILQVVIAPFPGEISGFVGGYLFGGLPGFFYSSIGLASGSAINFWIGRLLGKRFVRNLIPEDQLKKVDRYLERQGIVLLLILFLIPGFPKDYLCMLLGVSSLPFGIFILLASFGRMPGTLMLSLQGDLLYTQNYAIYTAVFVVSILLVAAAVRYRKAIYAWAERMDKR